MNYQDFLATKSIQFLEYGKREEKSIHPMLFPFQQAIIQWAVRKGRAAIFADTGLGKSFIQIEWARLIGERTLILAPLSVARQTVNEAAKIGVEVHYTRAGDDLIDGINITNYEMLSHFSPSDFGAVILDESSILKSLDSKTRQRLIEAFADTPYRLCCTATPAPNDITELANHAEFLSVMTRQEMLASFFIHDNKHGSGSGWRLKKHAEHPFYQWLASWSMSVKKPSDIGAFDDTRYILPELSIMPVYVDSEYVPEGQLFFTGLKGIQDRNKARKGTIQERITRTIEMVNASSDQWILWCGRNDESTSLARGLGEDAIEITGSHTPDQKIAAIEAFQSGKKRILVTKPRIAGYGINLQNCHHMAFIGLSDSFEDYYQCIRRCYRFGQDHPVHVSIILSSLEQAIYTNVLHKEQEAARMSDALIASVKAAEQEELAQVSRKEKYMTSTIKNDDYTLMLGDSCERLAEVADASIDLSIFSPPFQSLYVYSPTSRDLGNSQTPDVFYQHFDFIIRELMRVMKPGRNVCVHVQQVAASLVNDGYIGIKDFRGDVIRQFSSHGFVYHGEVCIDKNPQVQAIRTKAKGLLFVQLHKDASWMRPGFADYIIVFRTPGENTTPIVPDMNNEEWIQWAHPVWYGIKETETLNATEGKENDDERHVAPLQLETIERCVRLWSNPGETVLSPFAGIGSEGYVSIQHNRKFIGIELKASYFNAAHKNLERILQKRTQTTLFGILP